MCVKPLFVFWTPFPGHIRRCPWLDTNLDPCEVDGQLCLKAAAWHHPSAVSEPQAQEEGMMAPVLKRCFVCVCVCVF